MNYRDLEKYLIFAKLFLLYAAMVWIGYFASYLEWKGFKGSQIGSIFSLFTASLFFVLPVWGLLADKFGAKRIFLLVSAIASVMLLFLREINTFSSLMFYMFILSLFYHPLVPSMESIAIYYVRNNNKASFGLFRVFGTFGWGISSIFVGHLMDKYNPGIVLTYAFFIFILIIFLTFWMIILDKQKISGTSLKLNDLKAIFHNRDILLFLLVIFLYGICVSPLNQIISLYYRELGANNSTIGLALTVQSISEIPFFFFGIAILKWIKPQNALPIAIFTAILRLFLYSVADSPSVAILVGLLQGFTLSLFIVSVVEFMQDRIPGNLRASAHSITWAFHFGAGFTVGNLIIGILKRTMMMKEIMLNFGFACIIVLFLSVWYFKYYRSGKK